jgi:hypothetical protein
MKASVIAAAVLAASLSGAAIAQTAAPKLAPNVKVRPAYEPAPSTPLYVGNPTSVHVDITPYSERVAELDKVGERVNVIAKVKDWDWFVVGKDGVGIGYVTGDMLTRTPPRSS